MSGVLKWLIFRRRRLIVTVIPLEPNLMKVDQLVQLLEL